MSLFRSRRRSRRTPSQKNRQRRMMVESLEDKRMLAVAPVFAAIVPQAMITSTSDARITVTGEVSPITNETAIANESLLDGAFVYNFFVSTPSDILIFEAGIDDTPGVNVLGGWYNNTELGSDTGPLSTELIAAAPQLLGDAWLATPGGTQAFSGTLADTALHIDTTDDGAQSRFEFAQIALIPDANGRASATFGGQVQTSSSPGPFIDDFEVSLALGDFRIGNNPAQGTSVGTVRATDGDRDALTYSITSGNGAGAFAINSETGEITTAGTVSADSYVLTIRVEDTENLSATKSVTIHRSDVVNSGWRNTLNRFDVNADGILTPLDALLVINELNEREVSDQATGILSTTIPATAYFDVSGSRSVIPVDALQVINQLNSLSSAGTPSAALSAHFEAGSEEDDSRDESPTSSEIADSVFASGGWDA